MFGYIAVNKKQLSVDALNDYQAYYLGLCKRVRELSGERGDDRLHHDMTFLILIYTGLYDLPIREETVTDRLYPRRKRTIYVNDATDYAARMDILLSGCFQNAEEESSRKKKKSGEDMRRVCDAIRREYPRQADAIGELAEMMRQARLQREENPDIVSGYLGQMLSAFCIWRTDEWMRDLADLGFYLGKFICLLHAYRQLPEDMKKNNYNPLESKRRHFRDIYETYCQSTLTSLMSECAKSFERLPVKKNAEIIRHILYSGVWMKYDQMKRKSEKQEREWTKNRDRKERKESIRLEKAMLTFEKKEKKRLIRQERIEQKRRRKAAP